MEDITKDPAAVALGRRRWLKGDSPREIGKLGGRPRKSPVAVAPAPSVETPAPIASAPNLDDVRPMWDDSPAPEPVPEPERELIPFDDATYDYSESQEYRRPARRR